MRRIIYSSILFLFTWCASTQAVFALAEVRASATVTGANVTLGDLFDNLDQGQDIWVANAPAPGERATISTRYLASLTRQHNVFWQNSRAVKYISITREGRSIKHEELRHLVEGELDAHQLTDRKSGISFDTENATLNLPEDSTIDEITVKEFTFDQKSNKFTALVSYPVGNSSYATETIHGRTYKATYVPVLNKVIVPGDQITAADISWQSMPALRIGRNLIRVKKQLVGMTPRRRLAPNTPLKVSDLTRPKIIERGEIVRIHFQSGKISLTATGKAIQAGGQGDIIPVMNIKSHKTVEAVITGPNQVQVITAQTNLAQLNGRP